MIEGADRVSTEAGLNDGFTLGNLEDFEAVKSILDIELKRLVDLGVVDPHAKRDRATSLSTDGQASTVIACFGRVTAFHILTVDEEGNRKKLFFNFSEHENHGSDELNTQIVNATIFNGHKKESATRIYSPRELDDENSRLLEKSIKSLHEYVESWEQKS